MASRDPVGAFIDRLVARARLPTAAAEEDLRRELWSHFDEVGTTPEAWQAALTRFGAEDDLAEALRRVHQPESGAGVFMRQVRTTGAALGAAVMRGGLELLQDLRFGVRMLRRSPGVSLMAILCLTAGIGANTAVFGWIEGILFRPFSGVVAQDRLVAMTGRAEGETGPTDMSWPDFRDLERSVTSADAFIGDKIMGATLSLGDGAQTITGSIVSANYFEALGVRPVLGRGFEPGEDVGWNAHPVAVISYQLWKDLFAANPAILGTEQRLNGHEHTIVGVAPPGFNGTFVGYAMQVWVPASMEPTFETGGYKLDDRGARWIEGFVRLKPGVSLGTAQSEVTTVAARLATTAPSTNRGRTVVLLPLWQTPFNKAGELRPTLGILLGVSAFVLLIVCANVGNLLLVRALARRREMTIRLSIGASRGRLVRQLLTEGLLLTTLSAIGAVLLAYWSEHALVWFFPYRVSLPGEPRLARPRPERQRDAHVHPGARPRARAPDPAARSGRIAPLRIGGGRRRPRRRVDALRPRPRPGVAQLRAPHRRGPARREPARD